jgi:peroxiredoxin
MLSGRVHLTMASNDGLKRPQRQSLRRSLHSQPDRALSATVSLMDLQLLDHSLKAGTFAPAFALRDGDGDLVKLAKLIRTGPTVLSFHAGTRCQSCQSHVSDLAALLPKIRQFGARWLAIGPTSSRHRAKTVRASLLSDPGGRVAKAFGVAVSFARADTEEYRHSCHAVRAKTATEDGHLLIPATYVIDRDGQIVYTCADLENCRTIKAVGVVSLLTSLRDREATYRPRPRP